MSVSTGLYSRPLAGGRAATGRAAWLVLVAGAVQTAAGLATTLYPPLADPRAGTVFVASGALLTVTHLMVLAGVGALALTDAARPGWLKRIGFGFALAGLAAQVLGESVLRFDMAAGNAFFSAAVPACGLGMILVGAAVLTTHRWSEWRRFVPLACGLYVPLVLVPAFAIAKGPSFIALAGFGACYLLLGLAMRAELKSQGGI
jgi:hypothetical protein